MATEDMKKKLYLHIGLHKTGTSSIQSFLTNNSEVLKKNGILYPASIRLWENHNMLAWHYIERDLFRNYDPSPVIKDGPEKVWENLFEEICSSTADTIILSSEDFCLIKNPALLAEKFRCFETYVIIFLRRQDRYYQSLYSQDVCGNMFQSTDTFEEFLAQDRMAFVTDYEIFLDRWAAAFGQNHLLVNTYAEMGQDSIAALSDIIGEPMKSLSRPPIRANRSLRWSDVELVRRLNYSKRDDEDQRCLIQALRSVAAAQETPHEQESEALPPPSLGVRIRSRFEASNQRVARKYLYRDELFAGPDDSGRLTNYATTPELEDSTTQRIAPVINDLLAQIRKLQEINQKQRTYIVELEANKGIHPPQVNAPIYVQTEKSNLTALTKKLLPVPETAQEDLNLYSMVNFAPIYLPILECLSPATIVEIGSELGGNTELLGRYCINNDCPLYIVDTHPRIDAQLSQYPQIMYSQSRSVDFLEQHTGAELYFIDGDHNYQTVCKELELINDKYVTGPLCLILHDTGWPCGYRDSYYDPATLDQKAHPHQAHWGPIPWSESLHENGFGYENNFFSFAENESDHCNGVRAAIDQFLLTQSDWVCVHIPCLYGASVLWKSSSLSATQNLWFQQLKEKLDFTAPLLATLEWNRLLLLIQKGVSGQEWKIQNRWINELSYKYERLTGENP